MEFRPNARKGLWLCFLLPVAMTLTCSQSPTNDSYKTATLLAWILSIHGLFFALSLHLSTYKSSELRKVVSYKIPPILSTIIKILLMVALRVFGLITIMGHTYNNYVYLNKGFFGVWIMFGCIHYIYDAFTKIVFII